MVTLVGLETDIRDLLNDLLVLDFDAIEAYKAAIERLEADHLKSRLREFLLDHQRHTQALTTLLQQLHTDAKTGPDLKQFLTKGKVMLADIFGDKAILHAMKTNEQDTNTAYERALAHEDLPLFARDVIEQGLADERRHRAWLEQTISQLH